MKQFFQHFAFEHPWWLLSLAIIPALLFLRNVPGGASGVDFSSLSIALTNLQISFVVSPAPADWRALSSLTRLRFPPAQALRVQLQPLVRRLPRSR